MSIQTQITRLIQAKSDLIAQIQAKGVTVPADASLDDLAALVAAITGGEDLDEVLGEQDSLIAQIITALEGKAAGGGVELPELSNPASASDIAAGKEAINADGNVIEGTVVDTDVIGDYPMHEIDIYQTNSGICIEHYPKNDILMRSGSSIYGYLAADVFGDATAADVAAGKTFTSAAGLKVTGTASASGGDTDTEDALITRTLTEYVNSRVTSVGAYAFYSDSNIVSVSFPNAVTIGNEAFRSCSKLVNMNFPEATTIGQHGFRGNKVMTEAVFPKVTSLGGYAFRENTALTKVDFGQSPTISTYTFYGCTALDTLILRGGTVASLSGTNALTSTPIANGTGYVYVPASLVNSYKAASEWSNYAAQFRAIEDYPEITGG